MKRIALLSAIIFLTIVSWATDRKVHIRHFGESDGFSTTLVRHAIQDSLGYIWFATWDGLRRYDGYQFKTFKARPGDNCPLETNRISFIKEDSDHNIICWSNEKFYIFNRKTQQFETYRGKNVRITFYHAPQEVKERIRNVKGLEYTDISILLLDSQDGVWIYSHRGLERVSVVPEPVEVKRYGNGSKEVISAIFVDNKKRLWIADKDGYIHLSDKYAQTMWLAADGSLRHERTCFGYAAYSFYEDQKGTLWIGAKPGGLFRLTPAGNGYRVRRFTHNANDAYSINCDAIYDICEDSEHRLAIATFGGGLNIAEPQ